MTFKKKFLSIFMCLILICATLTSAVSLNAFAGVSTSDGTFEYYVDPMTREVTIVGYMGEASDLVIPASYNSKPIVAIGEEVFSGDFNLTSVTFAEGSKLETIGEKAFYGCDSLETITLPQTVTEIGNNSFEECVALTTVEYPGNSISLGDGAFSGCVKLDGFDVDKVNAFGSNCLQGTLITSVSIPDGVTEIEDGAFKDCAKLESVSIPSTVTKIGNGAFANCSAITSFEFPVVSVSLGDDAFLGCTQVDLDTSKVTAFGDNCLKGTSITSVYVESVVTSIGAGAFEDCTNLTYLFVEGKYTTMGEKCLDNTNADLVVFCDYESYANELAITNGLTYHIVGDANQDKALNIKDATYIQLYLARYLDFNELALKCADANLDTYNNIKDATYIQGYLAKFYNEL